MVYKTVNFTATITRNDSSTTVAAQLQSIIDSQASHGWEYVRIETIETNVASDSGCFGIGAEPGFSTYFPVIIFQKHDISTHVSQDEIIKTNSLETVTKIYSPLSAPVETIPTFDEAHKSKALNIEGFEQEANRPEIEERVNKKKKVVIGTIIIIVGSLIFGFYKYFLQRNPSGIDNWTRGDGGTENVVQPTTTGYVQTHEGSNLRLRSQPSLQAPVIESIPNGATLIILGYSNHLEEINGEKRKWCNVNFNGKIGWAWDGFIIKNQDHSIMIPINNLFRAWSELNLNLYMQQWDPNAGQYSKKYSARNYQEILTSRQSLFNRLNSVKVLRYEILDLKTKGNDFATLNVKYSMDFHFKDGKTISETNIVEKYVLKFTDSEKRWLILKNFDYID